MLGYILRMADFMLNDFLKYNIENMKRELKGRFCRTKLYSGGGIALAIARREAPLTSHKMLSVFYHQKTSTQMGFGC